MGNQFRGIGNVGEAPSGELALYLDAEFTSPVTELTEVDFGEFPWTGEAKRPSSKSIHIWARNEGNFIMYIDGGTDNPSVAVKGPPSRVLNPGEVVDWECFAVYDGEDTGNITFNVSFVAPLPS